MGDVRPNDVAPRDRRPPASALQAAWPEYDERLRREHEPAFLVREVAGFNHDAEPDDDADDDSRGQHALWFGPYVILTLGCRFPFRSVEHPFLDRRPADQTDQQYEPQNGRYHILV